MRENRSSGSEGGVALTPPSLALSGASRLRKRSTHSRQCWDYGGLLPQGGAGLALGWRLSRGVRKVKFGRCETGGQLWWR